MTDLEDIDSVIHTFFAAFTSAPDLDERLEDLRAVMLPEAVIVRTCGTTPAVYDVDAFIEPRRTLLAGGTLVDFSEWSVNGRTDVFGDIAHHFGSYAKAWVQDGSPVTGRGMKTIQLVRTAAGWRISAVAWDDEREGLALPEA